MEFENVNNINLAIEASFIAKSKKKRSNLFVSAVHRLKKWLRRAKPECACAPAKSEEELDNDLNELLEAKRNLSASQAVDSDLRPFKQITNWQTPEGQVPNGLY